MAGLVGELSLQRRDLGHVEGEAEEADDRPFFDMRDEGHRQVALRAVRPHVLALVVRRGARLHLRDSRPDSLVQFGAQDLEQVASDHFVDSTAQHLQVGLVAEQEALFGVQVGDHGRDGVDHQPQPGLALLQRDGRRRSPGCVFGVGHPGSPGAGVAPAYRRVPANC